MIETSDLEKTDKKLSRLHEEAGVPALQRIFGTDCRHAAQNRFRIRHSEGYLISTCPAKSNYAGIR